MAGIFPLAQDGGIAPNPSQPNNPAQALAPNPPPLDTAALYYGNGCDVRLRPHVLNSIISEIAATCQRAGIAYRASSLDNLETAVAYMIQRGVHRGAALVEQTAFYYNAVLDPPVLAYNDCMTVTFVPIMQSGEVQNQSYVRISLNGLSYVPLLRNDHQEVHAGDLLPGSPFIAVYYQGAFFYAGLCSSQVPLVLVGSINFWVRPDGNDSTGDGTANTADKAFRTIAGCWAAVGARYAASPAAVINIRLGVPGDYVGATLGPFGSVLQLMGDPNNAAAYRILNMTDDPNGTVTIRPVGCNNIYLVGINLVIQDPVLRPNGVHGIWAANSSITIYNSQFTAEIDNTSANYITANLSTSLNTVPDTDIRMIGNNHTIGNGISMCYASHFAGTGAGPPPTRWYWENVHFAGAGYVTEMASTITLGNHTVTLSNTVGARYSAHHNSSITPPSPYPGNAAGVADTYSTAGPGT